MVGLGKYVLEVLIPKKKKREAEQPQVGKNEDYSKAFSTSLKHIRP